MSQRKKLEAGLLQVGARPAKAQVDPAGSSSTAGGLGASASAGVGAGTAAPAKTAAVQPSRIGKKAMTFYVSPDTHREVRMLALQMDRTGEELFIEAINDLFVKHGKPPIASA